MSASKHNDTISDLVENIPDERVERVSAKCFRSLYSSVSAIKSKAKLSLCTIRSLYHESKGSKPPSLMPFSQPLIRYSFLFVKKPAAVIGLMPNALASVVRINSKELVVRFGSVLTCIADMSTCGFTMIFC